MLNDIRKDCIRFAKCLGDYQSMSCDELADGYCKARDEGDKAKDSQYFAALVLRFWYVIKKIFDKCPGIGMTLEDAYSWLAEAIQYACKYRKWQDKSNKVNAQQCINQCIETIRRQHYYNMNLDKDKANYMTVSMDAPISGDDDKNTLGGTLYGDEDDFARSKSNVEMMVQRFIDDHRIVEAIVVDTIAFNDCQKRTKEVVKGVDEEGNPTKFTQTSTEFWPFRVVQLLGKLSDGYSAYFAGKYDVLSQDLDASIGAIRKASNQKLYKYVSKTIATLKSFMRV